MFILIRPLLMKRISIWLLATSLLVLAVYEIDSYGLLRRQYRARITASPPMLFVSALRGVRRRVLLPDGSTVWLNAASTLAYPADIASSERSVELSGEAFFDVRSKPA